MPEEKHTQEKSVKSQYGKRALAILLFLAILATAFYFVQEALVYKWRSSENVEARKLQMINLPENSVDAVFLGASATLADLHPAVFYKEIGLRAFDLGTSLQPPLAVYFNLRETLLHHKPQLIIIDFSHLLEKYPDPLDPEMEPHYLKGYVDLQDNELKKEYLKELRAVNEDFDSTVYRFPFYRYHSRWRDLKETDFISEDDYNPAMMGAHYSTKVLSVPFRANYMKEEQTGKIEPDPAILELYDRIIALCRENDIEILSILPPRERITNLRSDEFREFAAERDLRHIDFNLPELWRATDLDVMTDFYDHSHVNIKGARKISTYLAGYIRDNFDIESRPYPEADKLYEEWTEQYYRLPVEPPPEAEDKQK